VSGVTSNLEQNVTLDSAIEEIIVSADEISRRVAELGRQISDDYQDKNPLMVCVLRGAFVFLADIIREISIPVELDFIAVSSYGAATTTSGIVRILKDLDEDIKGRHVIIIEDILDTGLTLNYLLKNLEARQPASLEVCVLAVKGGKQKVPIDVKYIGFLVPDKFLVGYGLDYAQKYRNLPYIASLKT
jgi:hypoxanthine phosphoribosyltransferase